MYQEYYFAFSVFDNTRGSSKTEENKEAESGWNCSSIQTLLGNGHQNLHETYQCRMYSRKLLIMGREDGRNM